MLFAARERFALEYSDLTKLNPLGYAIVSTISVLEIAYQILDSAGGRIPG